MQQQGWQQQRQQMRVQSRALLLPLLLLLAAGSAAAMHPLEDISHVTTVKELQAVMYRQQQGWGGAYKLLNATGRVGSQGLTDSNEDVDAPLMGYEQLAQTAPLSRDVVVLLPVKQSVPFFQQLVADAALQHHVKGVLVDDSEPPQSYSCVGPFPGAEYAPYAQPGYVWNAAAAAGGAAWPSATSWLPAPTMLLGPELAADARARAAFNAKQAPGHKQYHVRLKLAMTATAGNSSDCLAAGSCKPLGGFSVWAAMPPLPPPAAAAAEEQRSGSSSSSAAAAADERGIILVIAQMDGVDMFHDAIQGADAPLSGLVAMLAALRVLRNAAAASGGAERYAKRIVFLALAGEAWGYMGSRRLLYDADSGSNSTQGLRMQLVEQVIEVGQVGRLAASPSGTGTGTATLYAHSQRGGGFGDASSMLAALSAAAQGEAKAANLAVQAASDSNPGIPPSSLMSLLRVKPSIAGLVLAEFDASYSNPFYASRFDNASNLNVGGVAAAAALLAAGVHRLAGGDPATLQLNMSSLTELVSSYVSCVSMPVPGYACPVASALMSPDYVIDTATGARSYAPRGYVGVLQWLAADTQWPAGKGNTARFVWNVMAMDARTGPSGMACDPYQLRCPDGQVCAGWRASGGDPALLGACVNATVRYTLSTSTRVACSDCSDPWAVRWQVTDAADAWNARHAWPPDPTWAESDWPAGVPAVQLYLRESPRVEAAVLAAGVVMTAAAAAAALAARAAFHRHHKSS